MDIASELGAKLGLVSSEAPLISNLDIWRNIALISQYHRNIPEQKAKTIVLQCLKRYGLEKLADKRNQGLTEEERFYVMLLRASMVPDAVIVIDRPLKIVHYLQNSSFIFDALKKIDDLYTKCYTFDYTWNKNRYGTNDDSES
jgi:ABC-type nitrate/sulfonate/bicarbonate transport system ATPase subunit